MGNVVVYPNPVIDNNFRIVFPESVTDSQIVIYDFTGKTVYSGSFKSNLKINSELVFIFSVRTDEGKFHKKIIIK
ncbi:MAG: hypothetical protein ACJAX3_002194 [Patiriisocius sp.]